MRYIILKSLIKECGDNVRISKNVIILNWENLTLGKNISIHANCYIDAAGGICIGNNVSIAHNTSLLSSEHTWSDSEVPIKYNAVKLLPLVIRDDVWIGCGCRILGGIEISSRVIVAAGAVVNKDSESNALYGGVPARLIKKINLST
jgi:acetyltransferase-like isoleucine patch superfamily enzyme